MITANEAQKLWELVKPIKVGMLVSMDNEIMQARPMHLVQDEFNGAFYFFTEINTKKVHEIKSDSDVCLIFSYHQSQVYVAVNGKGSLLKDQSLINKFWNPFIAAWYPQGKEDRSVGLIKIDVHQAEYWEGKNNKVIQLFKYAKAFITQKKPDMGNHDKMGTLST